MIRSWRVALVSATVLGGCGLVRPAWADVTQTQSIPLTHTNWNSSTASLQGTDPLVFNQFNPSAHPTQTLQEVDITVKFNETNTYSMTFTGPATISVTAIDPADSIYAPTIAADTASGKWPLSSFIPSLQVQDAAGLLTRTVTEGKGVSYPLTLGSASLTPANISTSQSTTLAPGSPGFNAFVGSGTISFPFLAEGGSMFSSGTGNGGGSVTTQSGVTMTVAYITTQNQIVPEPSSVVLLGLGAAGLFVARRWRSSAARNAGA